MGKIRLNSIIYNNLFYIKYLQPNRVSKEAEEFDDISPIKAISEQYLKEKWFKHQPLLFKYFSRGF